MGEKIQVKLWGQCIHIHNAWKNDSWRGWKRTQNSYFQHFSNQNSHLTLWHIQNGHPPCCVTNINLIIGLWPDHWRHDMAFMFLGGNELPASTPFQTRDLPWHSKKGKDKEANEVYRCLTHSWWDFPVPYKQAPSEQLFIITNSEQAWLYRMWMHVTHHKELFLMMWLGLTHPEWVNE